MANWCSHWITFIGDDEKINNLMLTFEKIKELEEKTCLGQIHYLIEDQTDLNWMHNIQFEMDDDYISFETKWSPAVSHMKAIADLFDLDFELSCEELGNNIYEEYHYKNKAMTFRELDDEDFGKNEFEYESESEYYGGLLEKKEFKPWIP